MGSGGHLCAERFCLAADIKAVHIPYAGAPLAMTALAAGQIDFYFDSVGNSQPMVLEGKINGLAITGARRMPVVPTVPTMMESGYPGFDADLWLGLLGPRGMPPGDRRRAEPGMRPLPAQPAVQKRLHDAAYEAAGGPPEVFARRLTEDLQEWGEVVRARRAAAGVAARRSYAFGFDALISATISSVEVTSQKMLAMAERVALCSSSVWAALPSVMKKTR